MDTKEYKTKELWERFIPYFRRYYGTLALDLFCAALTTVCELVLPMIMRYITNEGIKDLASLTVSTIAAFGGVYLALRVVIGEGAGRNWWCVVFPPLCTAASADVPAAALSAGLSEEQVGLITEEDQGYVLKFKAVEWWEQVRVCLEGAAT